MYAPSPVTCMHTPQREFAGAKVQQKMIYANKNEKMSHDMRRNKHRTPDNIRQKGQSPQLIVPKETSCRLLVGVNAKNLTTPRVRKAKK